MYKVPYVGFKKQYEQHGHAIMTLIEKAIMNGDFILRNDVYEFEQKFARYLGVKHAISVGNCTDAMRLSLKITGIGYGDKVLVSSHTFLATLDAIYDVGATPVLVDSDVDYNMDTRLLENIIIKENISVPPHYMDKHSKIAILPVHLNGRVCNMDNIVDCAKNYGLVVIEDAAQALGAYYRGKLAGTFGIAGCFSFFPAKILGCYGDGGIIVTNDDEFAFKAKAMRDYGRIAGQEQVLGYGYNSRLDNIQAVVLNYKLQYLHEWIDRRRYLADIYDKRLCNLLDVKLPPKPEAFGTEHFDVYQNYVIRAVNRDDLMGYLDKQGIETYSHWETPLNKQYKLGLTHYSLPVTENICNEVVSLPMYPELDDWQVDYVCEKIQEFYK